MIVAAVGLMAYLTRDARLIRRFRPTALVLGGVVVLGVLAAILRGRGGLGGVQHRRRSRLRARAGAPRIAYEGADLLLLVLGIPVVAVLALTVSSFPAARRRDACARSWLSPYRTASSSWPRSASSSRGSRPG